VNVFTENDRRFQGLEPRTGLFVAVAVLILLGTIIASMIQHDAFTPTTRVYFFAHSAQGIRNGMSVQLSGFKVGSVRELRIQPDARVRVMLAIDNKYTALIPEDSAVGLAKEALIGASYIEIEPGKNTRQPVTNESVLQFYRVIDFADMAQDLKIKLDPILADIKKVTQSINDPQGDIHKTIANVRQATELVAQLAQQVNALAKHADSRIDTIAGKVENVLEKTGTALDSAKGTLDTAKSTLARARGTLDTAAHSLDPVDQQLPALLLRLDRSLSNIEAVTTDARKLSTKLDDELPTAIRAGRGLVEDTHEIVEGAKRAWPVRNFVPPPGQKALPLDSYDSRDARSSGEGAR